MSFYVNPLRDELNKGLKSLKDNSSDDIWSSEEDSLKKLNFKGQINNRINSLFGGENSHNGTNEEDMTYSENNYWTIKLEEYPDQK